MTAKKQGWLVFDCEIKHGVTTEYNPPQAGYRYANGWQDFAGMGVSVCCAFDSHSLRPRVFCDDNLKEFEQLAHELQGIIGWNNSRFDDPLLMANGVNLDGVLSIDLAKIFWAACGLTEGPHPKGLGLDATCRANGIQGKTGEGKNAPQDWQDGKTGRVVDYCFGDVDCLIHLLRRCMRKGGLIDPRTEQLVRMELPNDFL